MGRRVYNKLVRDKIPEIISANGEIPVCENPDDIVCLDMLAEKLCEEAKEYSVSRETEELADVAEVMRAILVRTGITPDELEAVRKKKYDERGGFEKGIRLLYVEETGR